MKIRSISVLILNIFLGISNIQYSYSQINENTNLPNVMPSNPKAFEFMKYGEIPISKYTGVPNIFIPIYTIKAKGLDVPINLSYHASGFKVNEEAGWTGLGWTLNVGGSITQVVKGSDDFGYYKNRTLPDFEALYPNLPQSSMATCSQFYIAAAYGGGAGGNLFGCSEYERINPSYVSGYWDSEPDIFKFNTLGYSGEFLLDWENENFVCLTDSKIKIEAPNYENVNDVPMQFYITVSDGHRFLFHLKEEGKYVAHITESEEAGSVGAGPDMKNTGERAFRTYQLVEIFTNKGDVINFNYDLTNDYIGLPSVSQNMYFYDSTIIGSNSLPQGATQFDIVKSIIATEQKYSYLSSIDFANGSIEFTTSDRTDINGAKKLDQVEVKKGAKLIKSFDFDYSYFVGHSSGTNLDNCLATAAISKTNNELRQRLKLLSVQELGKPAYSFEYNESFPLPKKTSLATDYWGYYNGFLANESTFPNLYRFNAQGDNSLLTRYKDNNKSSRLDYTKSAVLSRINYPTGGYSEFDYELNSFDNYLAPAFDHGSFGSVRLDTWSYTNDVYPSEALILSASNTTFRGSAYLSTNGCSFNDLYDETYIRITNYKEELIPIVENLGSSYETMFALHSLGLIVGSPNFNQANYDLYIDKEELIQMTFNDPETLHVSDIDINLNKGVVLFQAYGGCGTYSPPANTSGTSLTLTYADFGEHAAMSYGAGLRVSSISNYSKNNQLATKKEYEYEGGKLMTPLVYAKKSEFINQYHAYCAPEPSPLLINQFNGTKLSISSSNIASLSTSASGSYVGYSKVTERDISNQSNQSWNGSIVTEYTNEADISSVGNGEAIYGSNQVTLPPQKQLLDNGLVKKEQYFSVFTQGPRKEIINNYSPVINNDCFYGAKYALKELRLIDELHLCFEQCYIYQIGAYSVKKREPSQLTNSTEINYLEGRQVKFTEYGYNSYNQLNYTKTTNSNEDVIETRIKYPHDFSGVPFNNMVADNFLSPIVEKEVKVNSSRVELQRFDYKKWQQFFSLSYPLAKYSMATGPSGSLEDLIVYESHGEYGNIQQVSKKDGPPKVYIWGYERQYPIAEIVNATYAEVSSQVANLESKSNLDIDRTIDVINLDGSITKNGSEGNLREALRNLRNSLPNALVTTYTYDPLVGVTSITDPTGFTTYYEYDAFNRLKQVIDAKGHILSENEYNYKP